MNTTKSISYNIATIIIMIISFMTIIACHSDNDNELISQEDSWSGICMLEDGTYWVYKFNTQECSESSETWLINGTEQLGDREYVKLCQTSQDMSNEKHILHLREESGHVYIPKSEYIRFLKDFHGIDNPYLSLADRQDEVLLYNFNLKAGSRYPCKDEVFIDSVTMVVMLDGKNHKMFWLNNGLQVLEGIGCLNSVGGLVAYQNTEKSGVSKYADNLPLNGVLHYVTVQASDGKSRDLYYEQFFESYTTEYHSREEFSDYQPFVKEGKRWICETHSYVIHGDTNIVNKQYKKVYLTQRDNQQYYGAVRENNMRVFIRRADDPDKESLLYDFKPQSTDEISYYIPDVGYFTVGIYKPSQLCWVNGLKRRVFPWILIAPDGVFATKLYYTYEGVGSQFDPFNIKGEYLLFCYEEDKCIFTRQDEEPEPVENIFL